MDESGAVLCVPLTPTQEFQMHSFLCIVDGPVITCGCKDGRVFQFGKESYDMKRSLRVHNSWVSAMALSNEYFVTGSYDSTVQVCSRREIFEFSRHPSFLTMREHKDYVLAVGVSGRFVLSSSSDCCVIRSEVKSTCVSAVETLTMQCTVHCISCFDDTVFLGCANGVIEKRRIENLLECVAKTRVSACVKAFCVKESVLVVGCLDGSCHFLDSTTLKTLRTAIELGSRIVSIFFDDNLFCACTASGDIVNLDTTEKMIEIGKGIENAMLTSGPRFHICCDDCALFCLNADNEILMKVQPGVGYTKAQRLAHSCQVLCRTRDKVVQLWNPLTLQMDADFGIVKFRDKLRELSKSPSFYIPFSVDVSTGQVTILFTNVLRKLYHPKYLPQFQTFRNIFETLIENDVEISLTTSDGRVLWKDRSTQSMPQWTKYFLDSKYEPKVTPFSSV